MPVRRLGQHRYRWHSLFSSGRLFVCVLVGRNLRCGSTLEGDVRLRQCRRGVRPPIESTLHQTNAQNTPLRPQKVLFGSLSVWHLRNRSTEPPATFSKSVGRATSPSASEAKPFDLGGTHRPPTAGGGNCDDDGHNSPEVRTGINTSCIFLHSPDSPTGVR